MLLFVSIFLYGSYHAPFAQAQALNPITGWAWSDTIGWLSFNCLTGSSSSGSVCASRNYGVSVNLDLTVTGYAWSENIGWVKFGGLSGFPGGVSSNTNAHFAGNTLAGWVRACAGTVSGDCISATRTDGWDGWIYLGSTGKGDGVTTSPSGNMSGFAWGSNVVGWLNFAYAFADVLPPCASTTGNQCVSPTVSRYTDPYCAVTNTTCPYGCQVSSGTCYTTAQSASGCLSIGSLASCRDTITIHPGTVQLFWDITSASSCVLSGSGGEGGVTAGAQWNTVSQANGMTTNVIVEKTKFTLNCVGVDGSVFTDSVTVNITPRYIEPSGVF